ncbi:hypothetical protein HXP44_27840 [Streptomyces sioyaensis]|uniref:Uncharacterized protein n=1 Tax=Streptomyces sioyaensis TaxID=67364 RepID=A0A4V1NR92_9ACTN|nr:hypothetical protein [Streptomyces sioyaensis]MBM4795765.1 hypothetical protein [Streptomyces sioyaensis]RXS71009.1 hypothetical protein EST54_00900 [Streptomyces sioyaensis]
MTNNRVTRRGGRLMALTTASLGLVATMAVPAAAADDGPAREQLIADCASGDGKCSFNEPKLGKAYLGDFRQVSNSLYNCSTSNATQSMGWSDTVGSTDSAGVSVTAGGKIAGLIDLSVTATYNHTWSSSHTEDSSLNMTVKPGEVGWISRAQVMQTVSGTWQTHYDSPKWGHYFWFVPDKVTGPAANGTDGQSNAVTVKTRKMTTAEKKSCSAGVKKGRAFVVKR